MSFQQNCISKIPTLTKGALDSLSIKIVKNLNLLEKAQLQKIGNFLITNCFYANKWIPPSYVDFIDTTQMQIIADKCVADCVESLIGIHLLAGGQVAALHFIYKIGIETSPHKMKIENFPLIDVENMTIVDIKSFKHLLQDTENKI